MIKELEAERGDDIVARSMSEPTTKEERAYWDKVASLSIEKGGDVQGAGECIRRLIDQVERLETERDEAARLLDAARDANTRAYHTPLCGECVGCCIRAFLARLSVTEQSALLMDKGTEHPEERLPEYQPCEWVWLREEKFGAYGCSAHGCAWPDGDSECPYIVETEKCSACGEEPCGDHVLL